MNNYMIPKKLFLLCLLTFVGCGFHLRGNLELPSYVKSIYLNEQFKDEVLKERLRYLLRQRKISVSSSPRPDEINKSYAITISEPTFTEQVLAYSPANLPERLNITIDVPVTITTPSGNKLISTSTVLSSQVNIAPNNPIIQRQEKTRAQDELRRKAAHQILIIFSKSIKNMEKR